MYLSIEVVDRDDVTDGAVLFVPLQERVTLGRVEDVTGENPDIDLSPYEALAHGVSRRHAAIEHHGSHLVLTDLGSTNGTFLNDMHLRPRQPYILKRDDEIRLGYLSLRVTVM